MWAPWHAVSYSSLNRENHSRLTAHKQAAGSRAQEVLTVGLTWVPCPVWGQEGRGRGQPALTDFFTGLLVEALFRELVSPPVNWFCDCDLFRVLLTVRPHLPVEPPRAQPERTDHSFGERPELGSEELPFFLVREER